MDLKNYQKKLAAAIKKRDAFLTIALISLLMNVVLVLGLVLHHSRDRIIVVPAGFQQSFWVDKNGVSASNIAEMTRYFATLDLNMTPESSDYQIQQVLKYTDPSAYGAVKESLIARADTIKNEGLATVFFPVDIQVDTHKLNATITGDLSYYVGKQQTNTYRVTYLAQYRFHNGRLFLKGFKEVEKHA